uniref:Uncharacterized protein n=1 Tax=Oryza punctata TaxID=4537 RepID=A0A0E0M428_ORYPU
MPPHWRRRLLVSGLDDNDDIQAIASGLRQQADPELRCIYSKHDIAFKAFCLLGGLSVCLFGLLLFNENKVAELAFLVWGLLILVMTTLFSVVNECDRRRAKRIRAEARIILEHALLLSPV